MFAPTPFGMTDHRMMPGPVPGMQPPPPGFRAPQLMPVPGMQEAQQQPQSNMLGAGMGMMGAGLRGMKPNDGSPVGIPGTETFLGGYGNTDMEGANAQAMAAGAPATQPGGFAALMAKLGLGGGRGLF